MANQFLTFYDLLGLKCDSGMAKEYCTREDRKELDDRDASVAYISQAEVDNLRELVVPSVFGRDLAGNARKSSPRRYPRNEFALGLSILMGMPIAVQDAENSLFGVEGVAHVSLSVIEFAETQISPPEKTRMAWSEFHHLLNQCELPMATVGTQSVEQLQSGNQGEDLAREAMKGFSKSYRSHYVWRLAHMMMSHLQKKPTPSAYGIDRSSEDKRKLYNGYTSFPTTSCPTSYIGPYIHICNAGNYMVIFVKHKSVFLTVKEYRSLINTLMAHAELMIEIATCGERLYGAGTYERFLEGRRLVYGLMVKKGNLAMDAVKMLEPLCSVILSKKHGKVIDHEFNDNMGKTLAEIYGLKGHQAGYDTPLYKYLTKLTDNQLAEFCYAANTYGSCRGLEDEGYRKQNRRMQMESSIVPERVSESVGVFLRDLVKAHYFKHGTLPTLTCPHDNEYGTLSSHIAGQHKHEIHHAVTTGFGLTPLMWSRVSCIDLFKYTKVDHFAAGMEDKSLSPPHKHLSSVKKSGNPHEYGKLAHEEKKCVLYWLKRIGFSGDYKIFFDALAAGDMTVLLNEAAKQTAKEKEIKRLIRFFISFTPRLRHLLWEVRENFVNIAPYVPGQLSHLSESLKEETITLFSDVDLSNVDYVTLFMNIDFEAWNLYQTHLKTYPFLKKFDEIFGTSIFSVLHQIPEYMEFFFPGTDKVFSTDGANGLGEGQLQFPWTVNTIADSNLAIEKLGFEGKTTGSGDNMLGRIRIPKKQLDELYGGDLSLAANKIKESMCETFKDLGRVTKKEESLVSDVISILLKHLDVAGTRMPMTLKLAAKRTSYATMGAPTLTQSLGSLCGSQFAISDKGNTAVMSRHAMLYQYTHTISDLSLGNARVAAYNMPIPQLVSLMLAGTELGGLTYIPLRDIITVGHSDSFCSRIGIMQLAHKRSSKVRPYLDNLMSSPLAKDSDLLDLGRAPFSVPRLGTISPSSHLKKYIERVAKSYATGDEAKAYLHGASGSERKKLRSILECITPREPKVIANIYDASTVALAEKQLSKVMTESTMSKCGSTKDLKKIIRDMLYSSEKEVLEAIQRSSGGKVDGGLAVPADVCMSWTLMNSHTVAEKLRMLTWGIEEDTVTMPHPLDMMTYTLPRYPLPILRHEDVLQVSREDKIEYLDDSMPRIYPRTVRGSYTRSKTAGKVSKGFTSQTMSSPAVRALKTLLTTLSYTNGNDDSAAQAILAVSNCYIDEANFRQLATVVERIQGLVHHRLSAVGYKPEQHTNVHPGLVSHYHVTSDTLATLRETGNNYAVNISHVLFVAKALRTVSETAYFIRHGTLMPESSTLHIEYRADQYPSITSIAFKSPKDRPKKMDRGGAKYFYGSELSEGGVENIVAHLMKEDALRAEAQEREQIENMAPREVVGHDTVQNYNHQELLAVHNYAKSVTLLPRTTLGLNLDGAIGKDWVESIFTTTRKKEMDVSYDINLSDLGTVSIADFPIYLSHVVCSDLIIPYPEGPLNTHIIAKAISGSPEAISKIRALANEIVSSQRRKILLAPFQIISRIPIAPNAYTSAFSCAQYLTSCIVSISLERIQHYRPVNINVMPAPTSSKTRQALIAVGNLKLGTIRAQIRDIARVYMHDSLGVVQTTSLVHKVMASLNTDTVHENISPVLLLVNNNLVINKNMAGEQWVVLDAKENFHSALCAVATDMLSARKLYASGKRHYIWLDRLANTILPLIEESLGPGIYAGLEGGLPKLDDRRSMVYAAVYTMRDVMPILRELARICRWLAGETTVRLLNVDSEKYRTLLKSARTLSREEEEVISTLAESERIAYLAVQGNVDPNHFSKAARETLSALGTNTKAYLSERTDIKLTDIMYRAGRPPVNAHLVNKVEGLVAHNDQTTAQAVQSYIMIDDPSELPDIHRRQLNGYYEFQSEGRLEGPLKICKLYSPSNVTKGGYGLSSTGAKLECILQSSGKVEREHSGRIRHSIICLADGLGGFGTVMARHFPTAMVYVTALGDINNLIETELSPLTLGESEQISNRITRIGDSSTQMNLSNPGTVGYLENLQIIEPNPVSHITMDAELSARDLGDRYDQVQAAILINTFRYYTKVAVTGTELILKIPLDIGPSAISAVFIICRYSMRAHMLRPRASTSGNQEQYLVVYAHSVHSTGDHELLQNIANELYIAIQGKGIPSILFVPTSDALYNRVYLPMKELQRATRTTAIPQQLYGHTYRKMLGKALNSNTLGSLLTRSLVNTPMALARQVTPTLPGPPLIAGLGTESAMYLGELDMCIDNSYALIEREMKAYKKAAIRHTYGSITHGMLDRLPIYRRAIRIYINYLATVRNENGADAALKTVTRAGHSTPGALLDRAYEYLTTVVYRETIATYMSLLQEYKDGNTESELIVDISAPIRHAVLLANEALGRDAFTLSGLPSGEEDQNIYTEELSLSANLGPYGKVYGTRWYRMATLGMRAAAYFIMCRQVYFEVWENLMDHRLIVPYDDPLRTLSGALDEEGEEIEHVDPNRMRIEAAAGGRLEEEPDIEGDDIPVDAAPGLIDMHPRIAREKVLFLGSKLNS
jgi:hypothetical protein